jgi:hypothetical protein
MLSGVANTVFRMRLDSHTKPPNNDRYPVRGDPTRILPADLYHRLLATETWLALAEQPTWPWARGDRRGPVALLDSAR